MKVNKSFLAVFVLVMTASCAVSWDDAGALHTETNEMALSATAITPVNDPNSLDSSNAASKVYPPLAGTTTLANDIGAAEQILRNQTHTLNEVKVDRDGDTMTDKLTVNASTTNADGIVATGDGSGFGVNGIGGATGGGGRFVGTGNGSMGVSAVGGPSGGSGIVATGGSSSGLALELYPGTTPSATVPQPNTYMEGYLRLAGTQPNSDVDPGANNVLHATNITKMWAVINDSYAIQDGYNIASITTVLGDIKRATFVRAMANTNYAVKIHVHGAPGYSGAHNGTKATTHFDFVLFKTDTIATGFGAATEAVLEVTGRQ